MVGLLIWYRVMGEALAHRTADIGRDLGIGFLAIEGDRRWY